MPRHIDVEKVELKGVAVFDENLEVLVPLSAVRKALQMTPTADVVPKSEVEKLKQDLEIAKIAIENRNIEIEGMRTAANSYKMHYEKARGEVARQIFEEIDEIMANIEIYVSDRERTNFEIGAYKCHASISLKIAELKKKYIGESDVKRDTV